jgi:glutamate 5-kinase
MTTRNDLKSAQRLVVKLGTQVVTHDGVHLALGRIHSLVEDVARFHLDGKQMILVTSGAVAMGLRALGMEEGTPSLAVKQACAAIGQGQLMSLYSQAFGQLGVKTAQVLLSQHDLSDTTRALNLRTTLMRLLELGVVPILNENDSVSVDELLEDADRAFGDNDALSAKVATNLNADLLIMLSNVNGLFSKNPNTHKKAQRIAAVESVTDEILNRAAGSSKGGRGGMLAKLKAAKWAIEQGTSCIIASGLVPNILPKIIAGDDVGTIFGRAGGRSDKHQHIAITADPRGALTINEGALNALCERKASLLPIGLLHVDGSFERGDVVEVRDEKGRVCARGLVNYSHSECLRLAGHHSYDIERVIGWRGYDALVTRTNLVMAKL